MPYPFATRFESSQPSLEEGHCLRDQALAQ